MPSPGVSLLAGEFGGHRADQGRPAATPVRGSERFHARVRAAGPIGLLVSPAAAPLRPYRLGVGAAAVLVVAAVRPVADRPIDYRHRAGAGEVEVFYPHPPCWLS